MCKNLLENVSGIKIIGIDCITDYYDVSLKQERLDMLSSLKKDFTFIKGDIADKSLLDSLFEKYNPAVVVNLAAQAGVRYSIDNPDAYIHSNMIGFYNILECCRNNPVEHLVFASSSSVYGSNKKFLIQQKIRLTIRFRYMPRQRKVMNFLRTRIQNFIKFHAQACVSLLFTDLWDVLTWHILNSQINL